MITKSHAITEDRMMDAVCQAVEDYGIENLTTKQWAKVANVSEGSLYYHFSNKEDLLEKTFLRTDRTFLQKLKKIFLENVKSDSTGTAADKILNRYLVFLCKHPVEVRYYQTFCRTKLYQDKVRKEQIMNWSSMADVFPSYRLQKKGTLTEMQFFFTESVYAYAGYLCSFEKDMPDDYSDYIGKLLHKMLVYILEENAETDASFS